MRVIQKFPCELAKRFVLEMPEGAELISFQMQGGRAQLWAVVDPGARLCHRTFALRMTGHLYLEEPGTFVGTVQVPERGVDLHLFALEDGCPA